MDLFNRKKVEKLEQQLELLKSDLQKEKNNNDTLKDILRNFNCSSLLLEENRKLIDWIEKILTEFGTIDVRSKGRIQIPIYQVEKEYPYKMMDPNTEMLRVKEKTIIIPEIVLIKRTY